jgi:hypothetical protein
MKTYTLREMVRDMEQENCYISRIFKDEYGIFRVEFKKNSSGLNDNFKLKGGTL